MRYILLLLLPVIISSCIDKKPGAKRKEIVMPYGYNHYEIDMKLDPATAEITAFVKYTFAAPIDSFYKAEFYLHRDLDIDKVKGDNIAGFRQDRKMESGLNYLPDAGQVYFLFEEPFNNGDTIKLEFTYSGKIVNVNKLSANVVSEEWTEIGLYLPWFPYNDEYGRFTYSMKADIPDEYRTVAQGTGVSETGFIRFYRSFPSYDIVLAAGKNIETKKLKKNQYEVAVHYSTIADSTAAKIANDESEIVNFIGTRLGGGEINNITIIESLREKGGGYSRPGLLVLPGLDDSLYNALRSAYIRYIAHESAHFWFNIGEKDNWHDWLNESFAEYFALLTVEKLAGEEKFDAYINSKRKKIVNSVPIWGFARHPSNNEEKDEEAEEDTRNKNPEVILYNKGPLLLYELDKKIGREEFFFLCSNMLDEEISKTGEFLALLEKRNGRETRLWFENLLKTR